MSASPWFKVPLNSGQESAPSSAPLLLFPALSNTSSATASYVLRMYQLKMGYSSAPSMSALLRDPLSVEAFKIDRIYGPHMSVMWNSHTRQPTMAWAHGLFGIHNIVQQPYRYITFVRDPRITYISRLFYAKVVNSVAELAQFVEKQSECNLLCQDLARMFSHGGDQIFCIDPSYAEPRPNTEQALNKAVSNLERYFSFIGIAEYFNESVFMLSRLLGYPEVHLWQRQCATRGRPELEDLPTYLVSQIENIVAADIILYDHCKRYFLSELARADLGDDFRRYVEMMEYQDHPIRRRYTAHD